MGDPIELDAVASVYGRGREADRPLLTGSVKTNIGHLESAAGVAGLIKAALVVKRGVIPKHLHFQNPNPGLRLGAPSAACDVDHDGLAATRSPAETGGGELLPVYPSTNAHIVVEEYPRYGRRAWPGASGGLPADRADPGARNPRRTWHYRRRGAGRRRTRFLPLSGKSEGAVRDLAKSYLSWLEERTEQLASDGVASAPTLSDMSWDGGCR